MNPISLDEIEQARERIAKSTLRSPLVRLGVDGAPADIYLKLENLQPTRSFKARGAGIVIVRRRFSYLGEVRTMRPTHKLPRRRPLTVQITTVAPSYPYTQRLLTITHAGDISPPQTGPLEINPRSGGTISEEALKPVPEIRERLHDWARRHGDKIVT